MDSATLAHIKALTALDPKTLSERVVKLFEEGGELAKAVLPYENVSSTRHRFVGKRKILEEAVDCILVAYSIAHHLEYSDDEVNEVLKEKLIKWDGLLSRERVLGDKPIPFEIHVTVELESSEIPRFVDVCKSIGVKPIVLSLQNLDRAHVMEDVMTSSTVFGTNSTAFAESTRIGAALERADFNVVRTKIETVPWHPAAPQSEVDLMPTDCYFESHVAVHTSADRQVELAEIAQECGAHMSRNVFKVLSDNRFVQMLTIRWCSGTYPYFDKHVDWFISKLEERGFALEKKIVEFSVYDTRVSHDSKWISK